MANEASTRRDLLQILAALPLATAWPDRRQAQAQGSAGGPGKVDTKGLTAKIKYENVLSGYLGELNGKYKLRVTELVLEPGGYVGEHHHAGPGIRQVTAGQMTYVLPEKTIIYKPGDFFFESGDVNHTVYNKGDKPNQHLLFEILAADLQGPSLIRSRARVTEATRARRRGATCYRRQTPASCGGAMRSHRFSSTMVKNTWMRSQVPSEGRQLPERAESTAS